MVVEPKTRLRASCNSCNESKVRCSQTKPTCARCQRSGTNCIYGLSRRTHKDAPPISITPSQRRRKPARPRTNSRLASTSSTYSTTSTGTNTPNTSHSASSVGAVIPDRTFKAQLDNGDLFDSWMFTTAATPSVTHDPTYILDFDSMMTGAIDGAVMAPEYLSTVGIDYAKTNISALSSPFDTSYSHGTTGNVPHQPANKGGRCTCHTGLTKMLAVMYSNSDRKEWRQPINTQLARLRECISSSERSMKCTHNHDHLEPKHIMAVAMLIGYTIDNFEQLANENPIREASSLSSPLSLSPPLSSSSPPRAGNFQSNEDMDMKHSIATPNSNEMFSATCTEPRIVWGAFELEEDDEIDLRHRLYLLSFRKLERLLSQFASYVKNLQAMLVGTSDASQHMGFVIICDYTRMWLENKTTDVKKLFTNPGQSEVVGVPF